MSVWKDRKRKEAKKRGLAEKRKKNISGGLRVWKGRNWRGEYIENGMGKGV